jgi:hypothetical protein
MLAALQNRIAIAFALATGFRNDLGDVIKNHIQQQVSP